MAFGWWPWLVAAAMACGRGQGLWLWPWRVAVARACGRGHGLWPWPGPVAMGYGHGFWPWRWLVASAKALAVGLGFLYPWPFGFLACGSWLMKQHSILHARRQMGRRILVKIEFLKKSYTFRWVLID